jgi:hypothetical protein
VIHRTRVGAGTFVLLAAIAVMTVRKGAEAFLVGG